MSDIHYLSSYCFFKYCFSINKTLLYCCLLCCFSLPAFAQQVLSSQWQISWQASAGDTRPQMDALAWQDITVPQMIFQKKDQPVRAWYRNQFNIESHQTAQQSVLIEAMRHADETWLNNVKIGSTGFTHNPWDFSHTNPQSIPRLYSIPDGLLKPHNNVLMIKTNVGFGNAFGAMFPGGSGLIGKVVVGKSTDLTANSNNILNKILIWDTVFILLNLIDLLLILLLLKSALGALPEFKWLLFCSFLMLLSTAAHDISFVYFQQIYKSNWMLIITLLLIPYATGMYFWSIQRDISVKVLAFMHLYLAATIAVILLPFFSNQSKDLSWYLWSLQATVFYLYSIYVAGHRLKRRQVGAVAQLIGVLIYVISIRTQWLPDWLFGHRNIQIGSLIYQIALLVAYVQHMAHLRLKFEKLSIKAVHVADDVRQSIARELHDGIGQHLASALLHYQLFQKSQQSTYSQLGNQELNSAVTGLRRMVNGLHPLVLDSMHISEALNHELARISAASTVKFHLKLETLCLDKSVEAHIFRIVQESVNNALKHGRAKNITLTLSSRNNRLYLSIADDGCGIPKTKTDSNKNGGGFGLVSLQERVDLLKGNLAIESSAQLGTSINISLPLALNKTSSR